MLICVEIELEFAGVLWSCMYAAGRRNGLRGV